MAHVAIVTDAASRGRGPERAAMKAYVEGASRFGHVARVIDVQELQTLPHYDAVFLRLDTSVLGLSFAASRYAWELGLRTVDDPNSLLTCMNKAHVQGLLERANVPTPQTILLTRNGYDALDPEAIFAELGTPVVCKAPNGAFSKAVEKAYTSDELQAVLRKFTQRSDVTLLQAYTPSRFDWRIGLLCGEPLYAARYHIPEGGWRIHDKPEGAARKQWARVERVRLEDVPADVMDAALAAGNAIGTSLYGVDIKETDAGIVVIEVNDNPNMDAGAELPAQGVIYGDIIDRIAERGPRA
ncbi:MAG: ATP-grasp domain-containing protein [Thermoplasmatota archaeon]